MKRSFWKMVAALGILLAAAAGEARAQQAATEESIASPVERAALRAVARTRIQESIKERAVRPTEAAVLEKEARRITDRLSDQQLRALAADAEVAETIQPSLVTAAALGSATSELVFVPLTPCRIIDTRLGSGGKLMPGVERHFQVAGVTEFPPQGGNTGGCGVPPGGAEPNAAAVAINFVAVTPSGSGNMRAWAYGSEVPLAAVITYDNLGPFSSLSNAIVVPINGTNLVPADLTVRADFNATHLVADVTGYFTRFPVEQFASTRKSITVVAEGGAIDLGGGACTEVNSCTITSTAAGKVIVRTWSQIQLDHGTNVGGDRIAVGVKNNDPTNCTNNDQSINATDYELPDSLPAENDIDWTLAHKRIFVHPGGARTYYINARMITGATAGDRIQSSRMICTFIPD